VRKLETRATRSAKKNWVPAFAGMTIQRFFRVSLAEDELDVLRREPLAELGDELAVGPHAPAFAERHLARGLAVAVGHDHRARAAARRAIGREHLLQPLR